MIIKSLPLCSAVCPPWAGWCTQARREPGSKPSTSSAPSSSLIPQSSTLSASLLLAALAVSSLLALYDGQLKNHWQPTFNFYTQPNSTVNIILRKKPSSIQAMMIVVTNPLSGDCNPFHESRNCLLHTSLQVPDQSSG